MFNATESALLQDLATTTANCVFLPSIICGSTMVFVSVQHYIIVLLSLSVQL